MTASTNVECMMKGRDFERAKFSAATIREAIDRFEAILKDESSAMKGYQNDSLSVETADGTSWKLTNLDEWLAEYRDEVRSATLHFNRYGLSLQLHYVRMEWLERTTVSVEASDRAAIERVFAIFEDARATATRPQPPARPPTPTPLPLAPRIFVGHGRASDWRDLKDHLHELHHFPVEAYETGARTGHAIRDVLDSMLDRSACAVLVLTAEDEMADGQLRPRENVVHETGLFQGRLGWRRVLLLVEEGVEPFSNISGIQQIRYPTGQVRSTFGDVLAAIKREFGPGPFRQPPQGE